MSDSLRDQLLGLGFKPAPKPDKKPDRTPQAGSGKPHPRTSADGAGRGRRSPRHAAHRSQHARGDAKPARTREEMDLGKAYALRAQREKEERIAAERQKQEEARQRREAKARLAELLKDRALNDPVAEIARHFPYGGKIKRIYVTGPQLKALNAGELGVVQLDGRYLLIAVDLLAQAEAIFPPAVALKVDPNAPVEDDPYADPKDQVPDDLVW